MISTSVTSHSIQPLQQLQQAPQVLSKKRVWHCVAVSLVFILTLSNIISLRGGKVVDVRSEVLAFRPSPSNWSLSGLSPLSVDYENTTSLKEERDTSHKSISLDQGFLDNVTVKPKDGPFPENAPLSNENLSKPSHHQASEWNHALQETTKLLYRDSSREVLDYWLSQPPPKIYIYDTIPDDFSNVERISQCVDQRFLGKNISQVWAGNKKNCQWYPTICQDKTSPNRPKERMFVGYRYNYNMDVAYLAKFHRYPHQTKDPTEADIFVVPYPHKSHCLCHKNFKHYSAKCAVPFKDIETNVLSNLEFFKDSSGTLEMARRQRQRHLFFHGADWLQELKPFRAATSQSMTLSLGPVSPCAEYPQISCGHTAVPYLITDRDYQPHLASEPLWESIWSSSSTSERPYLVGAALSAPKGLPLRAQFLKKWKNWIGESMGGKPHQIINMGAGRGGKKPTSEDFMDLYRNSTVCLIVRERITNSILHLSSVHVPSASSSSTTSLPR
jgi:hypothetical protein